MSGAPTFDTGKKEKKQKRGEFITPPRPTGRRSKNTLKFDRPFDCVDFELLLLKSCYKTWSENEVLKHGLTTTLTTLGI